MGRDAKTGGSITSPRFFFRERRKENGSCYRKNFGRTAFAFLFGAHKVRIYRVLHMVICALGALISVQLLWDAADVCNGLMAIPNLFSLILFGNIVVKDAKDFFSSYDRRQIEKT